MRAFHRNPYSVPIRRALAAALALLMMLSMSATTFALEPGDDSFSDVPTTHSFYTAIMDCAAKGITSGYADGTFRPTNSVTRAQFCVMLSRAFYPDEVKEYDTKVYTDQGWFVPNTRALYMADVLKDTSFVSGFAASDTMDQVINRYDMARLMTNIMAAKGFSATSAQKTETQKKIADYKNIPTQYQDAVKNVFALGIITGYSNGTFGGNNVMNRGQGCVVIYRMMQYTPATTPNVDDSSKPTGNTGSTENTGTNSGSTGTNTNTEPTLSNGKPITEANVRALLNELEAEYPDGSLYAPVGTRIFTNIYGPFGGAVAGRDCAGWAALASDYIFGKTATVRTHKNFDQIRLGDVVYAEGHKSVISGTEPKHCSNCGGTVYSTCDSGSAYVVNWEWTAGFCPVCDPPRRDAKQNLTIITRYPANSDVPYLPYATGSGTSSGSTNASSESLNSSAGSSSDATTTTPSVSTKPTLQELIAMPCPFCGKTSKTCVTNEEQTKKVCSSCANTNRAAMKAYFNS